MHFNAESTKIIFPTKNDMNWDPGAKSHGTWTQLHRKSIKSIECTSYTFYTS